MIQKFLKYVLFLTFIPVLCLYTIMYHLHSWPAYFLFVGVMLQATFGMYCSIIIFKIVMSGENSESMKFIRAYQQDAKQQKPDDNDKDG